MAKKLVKQDTTQHHEVAKQEASQQEERKVYLQEAQQEVVQKGRLEAKTVKKSKKRVRELDTHLRRQSGHQKKMKAEAESHLGHTQHLIYLRTLLDMIYHYQSLQQQQTQSMSRPDNKLNLADSTILPQAESLLSVLNDDKLSTENKLEKARQFLQDLQERIDQMQEALKDGQQATSPSLQQQFAIRKGSAGMISHALEKSMTNEEKVRELQGIVQMLVECESLFQGYEDQHSSDNLIPQYNEYKSKIQGEIELKIQNAINELKEDDRLSSQTFLLDRIMQSDEAPQERLQCLEDLNEALNAATTSVSSAAWRKASARMMQVTDSTGQSSDASLTHTSEAQTRPQSASALPSTNKQQRTGSRRERSSGATVTPPEKNGNRKNPQAGSSGPHFKSGKSLH